MAVDSCSPSQGPEHEGGLSRSARKLDLRKKKTQNFNNANPRTRTRTNTNPNGTEANAAGRSGNASALRKQSKCGMIQEGEGHWPNSSKKLQKSRN